MNFDLIEALLSFQSGLLGYVVPQLRAVTIDYLEKERVLDLHFYYDGEITDKLFDLASSSTVEVDPGLEIGTYLCNEDIVSRVDFPNKLPITGRLVYLRNEPKCEQYIHNKYKFPADCSTMARLLLYVQQAMLGKIKENLRRIYLEIDETEKKIRYFFIFDGEFSDEDRSLADAIIDEASEPFNEYRIERCLNRIDYPNQPNQMGKRAAYSRYEGDAY